MEVTTELNLEKVTAHLIGESIEKISEDSICGEISIYLTNGKVIRFQPKMVVNQYFGIKPIISKSFDGGYVNLEAKQKILSESLKNND